MKLKQTTIDQIEQYCDTLDYDFKIDKRPDEAIIEIRDNGAVLISLSGILTINNMLKDYKYTSFVVSVNNEPVLKIFIKE